MDRDLGYRSNPYDEVGSISPQGIQTGPVKMDMPRNPSALESVQRDRDQALADLRDEIKALIAQVDPVLRLVEPDGDYVDGDAIKESDLTSPLIRDYQETIRRIREVARSVSVASARCDL
jgi:hypothetical protein